MYLYTLCLTGSLNFDSFELNDLIKMNILYLRKPYFMCLKIISIIKDLFD